MWYFKREGIQIKNKAILGFSSKNLEKRAVPQKGGKLRI